MRIWVVLAGLAPAPSFAQESTSALSQLSPDAGAAQESVQRLGGRERIPVRKKFQTVQDGRQFLDGFTLGECRNRREMRDESGRSAPGTIRVSLMINAFVESSWWPHIMVVDGEWDAVTLIRFLLEKDGHQVLEEHNGVDALAELGVEPKKEGAALPDLIILDVMMPLMDGYATATRPIPVVAAK
ncbi:MAG: response regulator [Elusimicrobia bacterium]|nr:response regulator [Elusimicrobiota bacterium]